MTDQGAAAQASSALSAQLGDAAARAGLGGRRGTYLPTKIDNSGSTAGLVIAAVCLVGAVIGFAVGQPVLGVIAAVVGVFVGGIVLLGRSANAVKASKYGDARLDLYEHGLATTFGGRIWVARYDATTVYQDITRHYRNGQHIHTTYAYTLTDLAGEKFVLRQDFAKPDQWGPAIQDAVAQAQFPRAVAALRSGQSLSFGDIRMTWHEVGSPRKSVPWARVQQIAVENGVASLRVEGKWFALTASLVREIPNFFVFTAVGEYLRRTHGAPQ